MCRDFDYNNYVQVTAGPTFDNSQFDDSHNSHINTPNVTGCRHVNVTILIWVTVTISGHS